ncbi:MAG: hypothetical protein U5M50_11040 [Sphingobium sp.]|nr:hypothetical protein [Sphingobium sp.]
MDANALLGDYSPVIRKAALGDLEAQRWMRAGALRDARTPMPGIDEIGSYELLFWSRLCASHGHEEDAIFLAAVLHHVSHWVGQRGVGDLAGRMMAEGVAILDRLSDEGSDAAMAALADMSGRVCPELLNYANEMKREVADAG